MDRAEYDLIVAANRHRDRLDEMKMIRLAQAAQANAAEGPSLFDRLLGLTGRGLNVQRPHRKSSVAA